MEIAIGLVALALAVLGIMFTYMWRANGRYIHELGKMVLAVQEGQREITEGIAGITEGIKEVIKLAHEIHEGQGEVSKVLQAMHEQLRRGE